MDFQMKLAGRLVALPEEVEPLLSAVCRYTHLSQERARGVSITVSEERLLYSIVAYEFIFPRGLLYRVTSRMKELGHTLSVQEDCDPVREGDIFRPFAKALADVEWRWKQLDAVMLPAIHHCGIIDCVTAFGKSFIVGRMCKAYPGARILVVVPGIDLSTEMHLELSNLIGKMKVGLFNSTSKHRSIARRVIVSTPESTHHIPDDWPDLVLYDECHTAPSDGRTQKLMAFNRAKMFGFTGTSEGRSDQAEPQMEAIFGPRRLLVTYEEAREHGMIAEITYTPIRIPTGALSKQYINDIDKRRYPLWHNRERNMILAREMISHMVANPGEQALFAVERTEHALYVQQAFKELGYDIPVVCGAFDAKREDAYKRHKALTPESNIICSNKEVRSFRTAFINKHALYAIATSKFSTGADFKHLRFLVYGSGESGKHAQKQWVGRAMRLGSQSAEEAKSIIIDAWDIFCVTCLRRSQGRRVVARKTGWREVPPRDGRTQ